MMQKITINYVGLDGEVHRGYVARKRNAELEDPESGEYFGTEFHVNGKRRIRIISKDAFLASRGESLGLSSNTPIKESKPSNNKDTEEPVGGLFGMLLLPSILCCVAFTVPLQLMEELNGLFPESRLDGLKIMFGLLPAIIVLYKTEDIFAALKWAIGTLVCFLLFLNIAAAIFGWEGYAVRLTAFYVPVILSLLALFIYSFGEG